MSFPFFIIPRLPAAFLAKERGVLLRGFIFKVEGREHQAFLSLYVFFALEKSVNAYIETEHLFLFLASNLD